MGKKKSSERGGGSGSGNLGSRRGSGQVELSDTGLAAVADAGMEQAEEEEWAPPLSQQPGGVRTSNPQLQERLNHLAEYARVGDIRNLVKIFVPHDLTQEETDYFASELEGDKERFEQLRWELTLIADGSHVRRIVGDQRARAEFRYIMPNKSIDINREVVFLCPNQDGDWRAEG